jgi:TolA-binding protein
MKKWVLVIPIVLLVSMGACDNSAKQVNVSKARADSLEDEVLKGHDIAMPKSMKIPDLQAEIKRMMDSIDKLPSKAKEAAAPHKADLESLNTELGQAYTSMESWMEALAPGCRN